MSIYIKPSKRGSLRKLLGVKEGNIPDSKLENKPGDSSAIKKKKNFARNARKFKHSGKSFGKLMGGKNG